MASLLVSAVLTAVASDARAVLDATNDSSRMIDWVNRTNKDLFHNSIYNVLARKIFTGTYVAATAAVTLNSAPSKIRRVLGVYDKVLNRTLVPFQGQLLPGSIAQPAIPQGAVAAQPQGGSWPEFYFYQNTPSSGDFSVGTLTVFPSPLLACTDALQIMVEIPSTNLTATSDACDIPDDGKDAMVAGTNMLAAVYLKRESDAGFWQTRYELLKKGALVA